MSLSSRNTDKRKGRFLLRLCRGQEHLNRVPGPVAEVNRSESRIAGFFFGTQMSRYLMFIYPSEAKYSGIVQHLLWDTGKDFPNQVLSLSCDLWFGVRSEKQT